MGKRHSGPHTRTLIDLQGKVKVRYNKYRCGTCKHYFSAIPDDIVDPGSHYTQRTVLAIVTLRKVFTIEKTREILKKCFHGMDVPISTIHEFEKREGY